MVGIIIASHGDFANGILQSAQMIFGEQENVKACTLMPDEGPEIIKNKMLDAIKSFDDQNEVLFLVDLWPGTPFNQANILIEGHIRFSFINRVCPKNSINHIKFSKRRN